MDPGAVVLRDLRAHGDRAGASTPWTARPSGVTLAVPRGRGLVLAVVLAACVLVVAAPLFLSSYLLTLLTITFVAGTLAAGVNFLAGQVGLVSMGQAGIAGAAAYAIAWATVRGHDLWVQLGLALLITLLASAAYGLVTMRSRGIVFLMITL